MATSITRATIIWFVAAGTLGAAAGALHLFRPQITTVLGQGTAEAAAMVGWGLMGIAALLLYHGMMHAALEQDASAGLPAAPSRSRDPRVASSRP